MKVEVYVFEKVVNIVLAEFFRIQYARDLSLEVFYYPPDV